MKTAALCLAALLALAACTEDSATIPDPVELTAESVGFYCQMNVLEHPGPKGQVHLDISPGQPLFFSQVRDVVAYTRLPEQAATVTAIYVNDMGAATSWEDPGTGNWVALSEVVMVVGSDMMGGMGQPELVPFRDAEAALDFAQAHGGRVMALEDIPDEAIVPPVADATGDDEDYKARLEGLEG